MGNIEIIIVRNAEKGKNEKAINYHIAFEGSLIDAGILQEKVNFVIDGILSRRRESKTIKEKQAV